jgi:ribosomal-protein-alanine N-acetyltransferase
VLKYAFSLRRTYWPHLPQHHHEDALNSLFDFTHFPQLETERLILREILASDAEAVFRIRGDYEVTKYNTGAAYERLEQAEDLIAAMAHGYEEGIELRWGITLKSNNTIIGMCGFNYWIRRDCRASIGYDLARAYWGHGIMTEAIRAIVAFGFERMGLNRIEADADGRNPASARVLEKVGFRREGLQHEQFYDNGTFNDLILFALLRKEFEG